jgi:peptidoglycan/LPS O-acetylase OafA/YrhL
MHGMIYNLFIPGGFQSFSNVIEQIIPFYNGFFFYSYGDLKIMSWLGAITYELGFFGIVIICIVLNKSSDGTNKRFLEILTLLILLFSAIPVAFPLIPFIFSLLMYQKNHSKFQS